MCIQARAGRIRQGGAGEEAALAAHLTALAPEPRRLVETGQLAELLVLLGHEDDARLLQARPDELVYGETSGQMRTWLIIRSQTHVAYDCRCGQMACGALQ